MRKVSTPYIRYIIVEVIDMPFGMDSNFNYAYSHDGSIDERYDNPNKKYVAVRALFETDGSLVPEAIVWTEENGESRTFPVKFLGVSKRASRKAGGSGWCFTVEINGKEKMLYLEVDKWFVETDAK
jgi:hypothetical protein